MTEDDLGTEKARQARSWAAALAVAAGVAILAVGLYWARTDDSEANDQEASETEAPAAETAPATTGEPPDPKRARALRHARRGSVEIDENSEQFRNRVELIELFLDYSDEARARRHELILWFLRNHPGDLVLQVFGELYPDVDGEIWTEAIAVFDSLVAQDDVASEVLVNYASWSAGSEPRKAIDLYGRLQELEPENPRWLDREAHIYMRDILGGKLGDPDIQTGAGLAKETFAAALEHSEGAVRRSTLAKGIEASALAGDADTAEAWARELLEMAGSDPRANHDRHRGHQGMGLAALVRGDTESAVAELLQMGDVPPGGVQLSFGPSMRLANELLARGEREAVIQYLEKVAAFWKPEGVAVWIERLRAGENFELKRTSN
jgi:tetratricopeptide (TPR) repeat protein